MGKAVAKLLASKGANVVIVARNVAVLKEALVEITVGTELRILKHIGHTNQTSNQLRIQRLSASTT